MNYQGEKILLVEDDQTLNFIIRDNLEQNGYVVTSAEDGEAAMKIFKSEKFSLCLLDVMLPKKMVLRWPKKSDKLMITLRLFF